MKHYILLPAFIITFIGSYGQDVNSSTIMGGSPMIEEAQLFSNETSEECNYLHFDENLFLCHWINDQTHAYWNNGTTLKGNEIIVLAEDQDDFVLPRYGTLWSGFKKGHNGLDIHLNKGDSVRSAFGGVVRYAMYNKGGFGNLVIIRHTNGLETYYAHLSDMFVKAGDPIIAGAVLGLGGSTGRSKGPHLHFEVRFQDKPLDPLSFIDYYSRRLKNTELVLTPAVFEPWNHGIDHTKTSGEEVASRKIISEDTRPDGFSGDIAYTSTIQSTGSNSTASAASSTTTSSGKKYHSIKKGETLYKVSKTYGTTVDKLCKLNGMKETDILQIGQKIRYQ